MPSNKEIELAWAAGFFDGEGMTCLSSRAIKQTRTGTRIYKTMVLEVTQQDIRPLIRFSEAINIPNKIYGPYKTKLGSVYYKFIVAAIPRCSKVMEQLWPYISEPKKEQYEKVLSGHKAYKSYITNNKLSTGPVPLLGVLAIEEIKSIKGKTKALSKKYKVSESTIRHIRSGRGKYAR